MVPACCPPGHGCNAPSGDEPCALELCRAAAPENREAAKAVARWTALERAHERGRGEGELRFRRRAFERARDRALIGLALSASGPQIAGGSHEAAGGRTGWRARRRRPSLPHRRDRPTSKPQ